MMDIRVRDAIRGKITMFDKESNAEKEEAAMKKQQQEAEAIAAKLDEGLFVVSEKEFFEHDTVVNECAIDAACIMDIDASIPSVGHKELTKTLSEACDHVGAVGKVFVPESHNHVLSLQERVEIIESFSDVDVAEKGVMFSEVENMIQRGITRVFAFVESEKVAEYRRLGRHFLRVGGTRFEIVEVKNKVPSSVIDNLIREDNLTEFFRSVPMPLAEAEKIFDRHIEQFLGA